jgi:hypothetical protein
MYDDYYFGKVAAHAYWNELNALLEGYDKLGQELKMTLPKQTGIEGLIPAKKPKVPMPKGKLRIPPQKASAPAPGIPGTAPGKPKFEY